MARYINVLNNIWLRWTAVSRLVAVNVGVFLLLHIFGALNFFSGDSFWEEAALSAVELPASFDTFLHLPWTIITYMFSQYDPFHLLFNMLWFYWFGTFLLEKRPPRDIVILYFLGGLAGAISFMAVAAMVKGGGLSGSLIGSSASVLAIVTAAAVIMPDRLVNMLFIGDIRLKWLALAMIIIDIINMQMGNTGGHIAHIGGMIAGVVAGIIIRERPEDIEFSDSTSEIKFLSDEEAIDKLLDKIRLSGYSSLTSEERDMLFQLSNRSKQKKNEENLRQS